MRIIDKGVENERVSIGRLLSVERRCGLGSRILKDKVNHGLGRINIREALAKYQTPFKIEQQGALFSLSFVLFYE